MTFDPLLTAATPIPSHALAAFAAAGLGLVQWIRPKGGTWHRTIGCVWVGLMAYVALSGFFIWELRVWGRWSPIHGLCVLTLVSLAWAVIAARRGQIDRHRSIMKWLYIGALIITGAFTLLPGRLMHDVVLGGSL